MTGQSTPTSRRVHTYEEPHLLPVRLLLRHKVAERANDVEHCKGTQAHSSIQLRPRKSLEGVDYDEVGWTTGGDIGDAHESRDLTRTNTDGGTGHKRGNGHQRNQLDNATETSETDEEQHSTSNDRQSSGNIGGSHLRVLLAHLDHDVSDNRRHDSHCANGDVLGCCECPIENETDEAGVETILSWQLRQQSVSHSLRNDHEADSDAWNCQFIAYC